MKAGFLYDDFSSDSGLWWSTNEGVTGVVSGGRMEIRATDAYDGVWSYDTYDLTGSHYAVKLVENASEGLGSITTTFTVDADGSNMFEFEIGGGPAGSVTMREKLAGSTTTTSTTYDAAEMVWFRLREASGTIYWETSADGDTWDVQRSKSTSMTLTATYFQFGGGYWDSETSFTSAFVDDFNLYDGPPIRPKTDTIQDDFSTQDTSTWSGYDGTNVKVVDGSLYVYSYPDEYLGLITNGSYDLTDSQICIRIEQNRDPGDGNFVSGLNATVNGDNNNRVAIEWDGTYIYFIEVVGGTPSSTATAYKAERHKWLRIRESAGTVHWETSIDGVLWTNRRSKSTTLDLTNVKPLIRTGAYDVEEAPSYLLLDDFNLNTGNEFGDDPPFPMHELTDDFSFRDDTKWYGFDAIENVPGAITVADGVLSLIPQSETQYLVSVDRWNLVGSSLTVQLIQNANQGIGNWDHSGSITTEIGLMVSSGNFLKFGIGGGPSGVILARERAGGVDSDTSFLYNPDRHKWFRFRESGGTVYWETSFNGVTWSLHRAKETALDVSSCTIAFFVGYWDTEVDVGTVIFDNFNLPDLTLLPTIGWTTGEAHPMGGVDGGTVQARNYFDAADWLWTPIPESPVLDPDSENISHYLTLADIHQHHSLSVGWYASAFVHPNQITPSTPRYTIDLGWLTEHPDWHLSDPFFGWEIPIPLGTQVPPGGDGHLCVADPVTGKVFSMWQAKYHSSTDTWTATYGGIADLHGDGRDYLGSAKATNLSNYAATPRYTELLAGEIPHALFVATNMAAPGNNVSGFRYPAQKSDGTNIAGVPYPIEEGSRIQLNPDIDLTSVPLITPVEITIGRALQRFGAYVGDQGGTSWPPTFGMGIELWQGQDYTIYDESAGPDHDPPVAPGYLGIGIGWEYFGLDRIPWNDPDTGQSNIRVLRSWDGS